MLRSIYVDSNSSTASLYISRSGYSHKLVIVTYITQQLNQLSPADEDEDEVDDGGNDGSTVAGVRVYPAIEGIDFTRSISTVALNVDVVRSVQTDFTHLSDACIIAASKGKYSKVKSFPSHMAHRAALISISMVLSQTPAYTARPWIRG